MVPSDGGIQALIEYGRLLGPALDFVRPWPDTSQLEELRALTLQSGVTTAELQTAASALDEGDTGRVALVAACAWAAAPGDVTDAWLRGIATEWLPLGVAGEQAALAAVLALDLGGRDAALEQTVAGLMDLSGGDEDSPSFAGLSSVRAWHALRGIASVEANGWEARFDRWFQQDSPERRVNEELWALAARSSAAMRQRATADADAALNGPRDQRQGEVLGALSSPAMAAGESGFEAMVALAESTRTGWLSGAAAKSVVASGAARSSQFILERLSADEVARDQCLEALRTWRVPADAAPALRRLSTAQAEIGGDAKAQEALSLGLQRAVDRLRFRRDPAQKERAAAALSATAAQYPTGHPWRIQLERWTGQLLATD